MDVLTQLVVSALAVTALAVLAGWLGTPRPAPPLDDASARALLAEEFPGRRVDMLWRAAAGEGLAARSGDEALILFRVGDAYAARSIAWRQALAAPVLKGRVRFRTNDPAAPLIALAVDADHLWPPAEGAA